MAKHVWSIPCQIALTNQETNSVSYIEALEGFRVLSIPFPFPLITVGTLWLREEEDDHIEMRIRILSPSGEGLFTQAQPKTSFGKFIRYRFNLRFGGFDITEEGMHFIVVEQRLSEKWVEQSRIPLMIEKVEIQKKEELEEEEEQSS